MDFQGQAKITVTDKFGNQKIFSYLGAKLFIL